MTRYGQRENGEGEFVELHADFASRFQEDAEYLVFYGKPRTPPEIRAPRPDEPTEPGWYWARWDPEYISAEGVRYRGGERPRRSIVRVERELKWGRMEGQPEPPTELRVVDAHVRFPLSAFSGWARVVEPPEDP